MSGGRLVWFTGIPSSGKSTLARSVQAALAERGLHAVLLDGDEVRGSLMPSVGYSVADREQFYRALIGLAQMLVAQDFVVLVAATAHRRQFRDWAREACPHSFMEVFVNRPIEECKAKDSKGLYKQVDAGSAHAVPGADLTYEPPKSPAVTASGGKDPAALVQIVTALAGA